MNCFIEYVTTNTSYILVMYFNIHLFIYFLDTPRISVIWGCVMCIRLGAFICKLCYMINSFSDSMMLSNVM